MLISIFYLVREKVQMEGLCLKFCRQCGESVKGYGVFCWKCGADMRGKAEDSEQHQEADHPAESGDQNQDAFLHNESETEQGMDVQSDESLGQKDADGLSGDSPGHQEETAYSVESTGQEDGNVPSEDSLEQEQEGEAALSGEFLAQQEEPAHSQEDVEQEEASSSSWDSVQQQEEAAHSDGSGMDQEEAIHSQDSPGQSGESAHLGDSLMQQEDIHSEKSTAQQAQGGLGGLSNTNGQARTRRSSQVEDTRTVKPRRPLSKMVKVLISAGVFLAVVLLGGYFYGASVYSKESVAGQFRDAVTNEDMKALGKLLYSDDPNLDIDDAAVESFLAYLEEHPSFRSELVQSVSKQAKADDAEAAGAEGDSSDVLEVTNTGKKWLVFNDYQLAVEPIYVTVSTEHEGTELYMNEKEVATADADDFHKEAGPFMVGIYSAKAILKNDFAELENVLDVEVGASMTTGDVVAVGLDADYVSVGSVPGVDGVFVINDTVTDLMLSETERIGPLDLDDSVSIKLQYDFPWGEEMSGDIPFEEDGSIYVMSYPVSDDVKDVLVAASHQYLTDWAGAYNSGDVGVLSNVTDDVYSDVDADIEYLQNWDELREIQLEKVVLDMDSFEISMDDDTYYASANMELIKQEDTFRDDEKADLRDDDTFLTLSLVYDDGDWIVSAMSTIYDSLSSNTKEFALDSGSVEASADEGDDEASGDADDAVDEDALGELMDSYETALFQAVNGNDFGLVAPYLYDGSALYEAQENLVAHLNKEGITEDLVDYEIVGTSCDGDACTIDVDETVEITYDSGDVEEQDYSWTYTAQETSDGTWQLSDIAER